jgi:hypothetical protein
VRHLQLLSINILRARNKEIGLEIENPMQVYFASDFLFLYLITFFEPLNVHMLTFFEPFHVI